MPTLLPAQRRFLVSSSGDVRPLTKEESARAAVAGLVNRNGPLQTPACSPNISYGYDDINFPANLSHMATHKNIFAEWFVAPYNGAIESVYVHLSGPQGDPNNGGGYLKLRIHKSNIFPGSGPGYGVFPAPPDTTCWGYFNDATDLDNHVGAFAEDIAGPDTAWQSKYYLNADHGEAPSFSPAGEEIWGQGGYAFPITHAGQDTVIGIGLENLGRPAVTAGEPLFISLTLPGEHPATVDSTGAGYDPTEVDIQADETWNGDIISPTPDSVKLADHDWKFYEHAFGHCADPLGPHPHTEAAGWVARGLWNDKIWYVVNVADNTPPSIASVDLGGTLKFGKSAKVTSQIFDCDFHNPSAAGIGNVYLLYWTNPAHIDSLFMPNTVGAAYATTLPAQTFLGWLNYAVEAFDGEGLRSVTPAQMIEIDLRKALRVRDNAGRSDSLVFVEAPGATSGIDTYYGEYGIAQEPPAGTFDVRWYLNDTAQSKIDAIAPALPDTFLFHVQPGGNSYPITISWDSTGFPAGTYLIEDALTHGSQLSVVMSRQSTLSIADSTGDSLEVVHTSQVLSIRSGNAAAAPAEYGLRQNYPDPFNPSTRIEYALPENSYVRLAVYNLLGQQIALLVDANQVAGIKSVVWNAANVPSGVYFCKLQAANSSSPSKIFTQCKKMLMIK